VLEDSKKIKELLETEREEYLRRKKRWGLFVHQPIKTEIVKRSRRIDAADFPR
jgi:hypothetical protein